MQAILLSTSKKISIIAVFTALALASDIALLPLANVKLVFVLVFTSAFVFGFRIGASIAFFSELIWGTFSPYGFGGIIIPFLVGGTMIYALAGYGASRIWGNRLEIFSPMNFYVGALMAICAFLWDLETNFATGAMVLWPHITFLGLIGYEILGAPFAIAHEISDFTLGTFLAPLAIIYLTNIFGLRKWSEQKETVTAKQVEG